jgi:hypothetical protein
MKRVDVDGMLEELSAQQLQRWFAFLAVRNEREAERRRDAAEGFDDEEVTYW